MMQAGMTRADIRQSVRMAQLPKELHETILAEVMRRKRLAQNVAINAVWRAFQRLDVWSRPLMGHPYRVIRRMRYGPSSAWERHDDCGDPSSDTA